MNSEIFSYIRNLSKKDHKNLQGKLTKHTSELGELASAVSSYESALGATHRFVTKKDILDEVADNILCSLSIAYDLDFSHEEIEEMLYAKAKKWQMLQNKELKVAPPYPFEIHITVHANTDIEHFQNICNQLNVKATILHLQDKLTNFIFEDIMTSSKFYGDNQSVLKEVDRIKAGLYDNGITVVRSKIETFPFHPSAPSDKNGLSMPKDSYFESHLEVIIDNPLVIKDFQKLGFDIKLSQNINKIDNLRIISITLRENELTWESFKSKVENLEFELTKLGITIHDKVNEFAIYDDQILHDKAWIGK